MSSMSLKGTVVPLALFSFILTFLSLTSFTLVYAFTIFYCLAMGPKVMWSVSHQLTPSILSAVINIYSPVFVIVTES